MAYEKLNLKTGDELNEAVFKHIDDGISQAVAQENTYNLTTSTDLLKDSFEYWKPYYSTAIRGFEQNFLTNKNEILLETVHSTTVATGNYISSPVIKVNTALDNTLIIDNTNSDLEAKLDFYSIINSLDKRERTIMELYYNEKYTTKEISEILNKNENSIKTKYFLR